MTRLGKRPEPTAQDLAIAEHLFRGGRHGQAEALLQQILAVDPRNSKASELMAYIVGNRGDLEGAFRFLSIATGSAGASRESWYYLGLCFQKKGLHGDALRALERALALGGEFFEALHDLGLCHLNLDDPARAVAAFDRAIAINPGSFEAHFNKARALDELRRYDDALAAYDRARDLQPGDARAWCNRGGALHDLGRLDEALASFDRALALSTDHAKAWSGRGIVLADMKRLAEAQECFNRALAIEPGNADFRFNEASLRLLLGDFDRGFPAYESRWRREKAEPYRHADLARWSGQRPVQGRRILIWSEQGLGDTIQFCRYAPLLAREGAHVTVEVQPALQSLISSLDDCAVIAQGSSLSEFDLQVPMLSLPDAFGTRLDTLPRDVPYLKADPGKVRFWQERLGEPGGRPRVGICCSGSPGHRNDAARSVALAEFAALQDVADLFVIQKGMREDDEAFLRDSKRIRYLGNDIADFGDTAGLVASLDLIVSVDTSLAHLAGALGRPVWILLPWAAEWRWLVDRTDSPWYPTATLFRQEHRGDWKGVMARVRKALAA